MTDAFIDFEWYRASRGYRLTSWKSLVPAGTNPKSYPSGDCIVANDGGEWIPYRPFDKFDTLYSVFANIRTNSDLFDFITKFGPLTCRFVGEVDDGVDRVGHADWGDDVSQCLKHAQLFHTLLSHKQNPRKLASIFNSQLMEAQRETDERAGIAWASPNSESDWYRLYRLIGTMELVSDTAKGVRLKMRSDSLIGALWGQLGLKLSGAGSFRECRHCGGWFEVGPAAGRRADAQFCCDDHRIHFNSRKRTTR